ncbi:multicomponent Na+:H+ antiporter subunit F [Virgibacillus natechei]|uniref:Multicomponent Na+:H+ antiporter subunit F n=1 Tax=Virgibacillus natechei TaxID=1216297 RepID=A0ABS4ICS1_9BACI|nr:Na(+)/H(+) antiporter subunit F1 [Virgibacillus natechei]MBP1968742.1 multicomponent Na+:H+ antiporter subunit F [Virgibacillus natechei]UZD11543.1 Na(+)/H(+) antiporter subunit F1 [Virgibacillus natechei]
MFQVILQVVLIVMSISLFVCFIRTIIGPTLPDRVLALDSFGINLIGFVGMIMLVQETVAYSDVALVLSILAFIGTIALSKFIERGVVFDRE